MGKSTISMAIFNSFLLVYQRVYWMKLPIQGWGCSETTTFRLKFVEFINQDQIQNAQRTIFLKAFHLLYIFPFSERSH